MNLVWPSKWEKPWEKRRSKPLDVGTSYIILPQTLMWANCSLILETRIEVIAKCFQFRVTKISNLPASPQIEAGLATILDTCFVFVSRNITPKMKSEVLGMIPHIETIIYGAVAARSLGCSLAGVKCPYRKPTSRFYPLFPSCCLPDHVCHFFVFHDRR